MVHVWFIRMLTEPLISSSRSFGTPARASTTESVNKHASMTQVIKADLGLQSFGNPSTRCRHNPLSLTDKRRCHQECRAQASRSQRKAKCMGKMSSACARPAEGLQAAVGLLLEGRCAELPCLSVRSAGPCQAVPLGFIAGLCQPTCVATSLAWAIALNPRRLVMRSLQWLFTGSRPRTKLGHTSLWARVDSSIELAVHLQDRVTDSLGAGVVDLKDRVIESLLFETSIKANSRQIMLVVFKLSKETCPRPNADED